MKQPRPWEAVYAHDRRQHRHRCRCCAKVINAGEAVLMTRHRRGTYAVHLTPCADSKTGLQGQTWREQFEAWAAIHARALGFNVPTHPLEGTRSII